MSVSAIVINYNAGEHVIECVRSLRYDGVGDVLVVDNASSDGSIARLRAVFPDVRVHETGGNFGYGGGVNRGLPLVTGEFVFVTNADVVVHAGAVGTLASVLESEPDVGIIGPRIDEVNGSVYPSARAFPRLIDAIGHAFVGLITTDNPFSRRYLMTDVDHGEARDADWVSGACFLARRTALSEVAGFDEGYYMYLEDVDLCRRTWRAGWRVRYEPSAGVTHVQGVSTSQTPYRMLARHHQSLLRHWWRTTPGAGRLMAPAVVVGLVLRLALMAAKLVATRTRSVAGGPLREGPSGR